MADMAATKPRSAPAPMPTALGAIIFAAATMAPLVAAEPPAPFASPLGLGLKDGTAKGVVAVLPCSVPAGLMVKPYDWPSLTVTLATVAESLPCLTTAEQDQECLACRKMVVPTAHAFATNQKRQGTSVMSVVHSAIPLRQPVTISP